MVIKTFLNPEGHQHPINGSKVMAILLKGWILPVGGASAVEGLRSTGLPRLVFRQIKKLKKITCSKSQPVKIDVRRDLCREKIVAPWDSLVRTSCVQLH